MIDYLNGNHFDAVGIGGCGGYYQYRKIKKICEAVSQVRNKPFFWMGGHLPSPEPEYFLRNFKGVDAVVIGEGEETCKHMLRVLAKHGDFREVPGMAFIDENNMYVQNERRELIKDVDSIPYPAWDLFTMDHYVLYRQPNSARSDRCLQMLSGRGCPFRCNFCYRMDSGFRDAESFKEAGCVFINHGIELMDDGAQLRTIRLVTPYPGSELYNIVCQRGLMKNCMRH